MRRVTAVAFAALALAAAAQAQQANVRLRAEAEARAPRYTLGDVAQVSSADTVFAQWLAGVEIGVAPRLGQVQSVPRAAIAARLGRVAPQLRGQLQWQGADAVALRSRGEPVDAPTLQRLAERTLADALEQRGLRAELRAAPLPADLRLPAAGARQVSARLAEGWTPARRMCVWLDVAIEGRGYRSVPVWFDVKAEQQVWVARESLPAGAVLQAADVQAGWFDVAALAAPALPATAPLDGLRLRRAVEAGRPLLAGTVEARPAVQRDQPVDVQLELGAIRLRTGGVALRDARVGDMVKVRSTSGREPFVARVVAEGAVRVDAR